MKIRSLLTVVAMLSVLLFGFGTAYAVFGVPDDVPGQDLVWPVICTKTAAAPPTGFPTSDLNTNWAISNLSSNPATLACALWTRTSVLVKDFDYSFTENQVIADNCADLVVALGATGNTGLIMTNATGIITVPGTPPSPSEGDFFAGYITCANSSGSGLVAGVSTPNKFMNNIYLIDGPLGFASGFNGIMEENGAGAFTGANSIMGENGGAFQFTAHDMWFRYYVNNDPTDPNGCGVGVQCSNTWDWLIVLASRNQYGPLGSIKSSTRVLNGVIYDENEHSQSLNVPIPNQLNIIDVNSSLPGAPFFEPLPCPVFPPSSLCVPSFPKAGYIAVVPTENGSLIVGGGVAPFGILGTCNDPAGAGAGTCTSFYSIFGWSYQRAQASSLIGDFDVIHPMLRTYCSGGVAGTSGTGNERPCTCTGAGC